MNTEPFFPRRASKLALAQRLSISDTIRLTLGEPPEPLSWEALSTIARIVVTPDDRPIRTIVTGRRHVTTGYYSSAKCGRALPFESMNEQAFIMHSEVDTGVVAYRVQPFRFEFVVDGVQRIYIADAARILDDGRIEVVEVKHDRRALRDPDYASKLAYVREICARLGWSFRAVLRDQLFQPATVYRNVVEIQSRRQIAFDHSHSYAGVNLLERMGGEAPLGDVADALGERRKGRAMAMAMMVARLLKIDLLRPLTDESMVALVPSRTPNAVAGGVA